MHFSIGVQCLQFISSMAMAVHLMHSLVCNSCLASYVSQACPQPWGSRLQHPTINRSISRILCLEFLSGNSADNKQETRCQMKLCMPEHVPLLFQTDLI